MLVLLAERHKTARRSGYQPAARLDPPTRGVLPAHLNPRSARLSTSQCGGAPPCGVSQSAKHSRFPIATADVQLRAASWGSSTRVVRLYLQRVLSFVCW